MKHRVLVLTDQDMQAQGTLAAVDEKWATQWKTEYDVLLALQQLGHEIRVLGSVTDLKIVKDAMAEWQPSIIFNLLESFFGENVYVPYLLGYFELMQQPFTGCNPSGLFFAYNKPLMKKIKRFFLFWYKVC